MQTRLLFLTILFLILALLGACTRKTVPAATPSAAALVATSTSTATLRPDATLTPTPTLLPSSTPTSTSVPTATLTPTPGPTVPPHIATEFITVHRDEFLSTIAARHGVSVADIIAASHLRDPNQLTVGQGLILPHLTAHTTPDTPILPDSELVYGPAYRNFDVDAFVQQQPGYLRDFRMSNGWSGADVVSRVAVQYSVGPRVLLALLEARGGWLSQPEPDGIALTRPLGYLSGPEGLLPQLEWAADELNRGFYGWQDRGETAILFRNRQILRGAPGLNPGSIAIQRVLANDVLPDDLPAEIAAFLAAYERLFGPVPWDEVEPVLPPGLEQPPLQLPWARGEWWYLTGGPHGGWGHGSAWAALDFVPDSPAAGSCEPLEPWGRAAADGVIAYEFPGEVLLDLDGDGDVRTGWVLQYLHIANHPPVGTKLQAGDPIGQPSCKGGSAESSHLHIARRYNGMWMAADGPVPFVLGEWQAWGGFEYEGGLKQAHLGWPPRVACDCRDRVVNGLFW